MLEDWGGKWRRILSEMFPRTEPQYANEEISSKREEDGTVAKEGSNILSEIARARSRSLENEEEMLVEVLISDIFDFTPPKAHSTSLNNII